MGYTAESLKTKLTSKIKPQKVLWYEPNQVDFLPFFFLIKILLKIKLRVVKQNAENVQHVIQNSLKNRKQDNHNNSREKLINKYWEVFEIITDFIDFVIVMLY